MLKNILSKLSTKRAYYIVFSLVASIALWVYVSYIDSDEMSVTVSSINVQFENEDVLESNDLVITDIDKKAVTLKFYGRQASVMRLSNDNVFVTVDLSKLISDGEYNAYIFADNKDGSDLEVTVLNGLTSKDTIKRSLLPNGGFVIKLTKGTMKLTTPYSNYKSYEAENAKLSGKASITAGKQGKYCSNDAYVGWIGGGAGNDVTFTNVSAPADGEYTLRIYYVSGEPRSLMVDINGQYAGTLDNLYANKNDWSGIRAVNMQVNLRKGDNSVKLYNTKGNGPSIDRIAIALPADELEGDINFDGSLGVADLVCMERYLLGAEKFTASQYKAADLDKDGVTDTFDLVALRKLIV